MTTRKTFIQLLCLFINFSWLVAAAGQGLSIPFPPVAGPDPQLSPFIQERCIKNFHHGLKNVRRGRISHAEMDFRKSIRNNYRFNSSGYNNYAVTSALNKDFLQSRNLLMEAAKISRNPSDTIIYNLSLTYLNLTRPDSALLLMEQLNCNNRNFLMNKGYACFVTGNTEYAKELFTEAASMSHKDPVALYNRALAMHLLGDYTNSGKDFLLASRWAGRKHALQIEKGKAWTLFRQHDYNGAISSFCKAMNNSDNYHLNEEAIGMAFSQLKLGKYQETLELLSKMKQEGYSHELLSCALGITYSRLGEPGKATYVLGKVLKNNPNCITAYFGLADMYLVAGNFESAAEVYEKLYYQNHDKFSAALGVAIASVKDDKFKKAGQWFDECRKLDSAFQYDYSILYMRGITYYNLGDFDKSRKDFLSIELMKDGQADYWIVRGSVSFYNGKYKESSVAFGKAIKLDPKNDVALVNRGNALIELRKYEKAEKDFRKALAINPGNADACNGMALTRMFMGELSTAHSFINKAISIKPNEGCLVNNKGFIQLLQGRMLKDLKDSSEKDLILHLAIQDFVKALNMGYLASGINLANAFVYTNKGDTAQTLYSKSIFSSVAMNNRGFLNILNENFSDAEKDFSEAINLDNTNKIAAYNLSRAKSGSYWKSTHRSQNKSRTKKYNTIISSQDGFILIFFYQHMVNNSKILSQCLLNKLPIEQDIIIPMRDYRIMSGYNVN